jgi:hypothetical protein
MPTMTCVICGGSGVTPEGILSSDVMGHSATGKVQWGHSNQESRTRLCQACAGSGAMRTHIPG